MRVYDLPEPVARVGFVADGRLYALLERGDLWARAVGGTQFVPVLVSYGRVHLGFRVLTADGSCILASPEERGNPLPRLYEPGPVPKRRTIPSRKDYGFDPVWYPADWPRMIPLERQGHYASFAVDPVGNAVYGATGDADRIQRWGSGPRWGSADEPTPPLGFVPRSLSCPPSGRQLAGVGVPGGGASAVRVWATADWSAIGPDLPADRDSDVAWSLDGSAFVISRFRRADVYRSADLAPVATMPTGEFAAALSADGRLALTEGPTSSVCLWDVAAGREAARWDFGIGVVRGVSFAADGLTAAAGGSRGKVVVWDLDV